MRRAAIVCLPLLFLIPSVCLAQSPATAPAGAMPHVQVDVKKKQVRVECEALNVDIPLEFFCVTAGGNEHESVLRTAAKPSHIHLALLMLGLQPGEPVKYSEAAQKWFPPHGPPLQISVTYQKDGKSVTLPANELMRSVKAKKPMPPTAWIFAGSRILDDGTYGADPTGHVVSICNFDLCLIDVPQLVSSANETLEWERNPDTMPATGTPVTMIIEPAGDNADTSKPQNPSGHLSDVSIDQVKIDHLRDQWNLSMRPRDTALRAAAHAQYEAITQLRREQQRLIDEADRVQRVIDELEKEYQDMTAPRAEATSQP